MKYRITNKKNQTAEIDAHRYEQDGSGVRFYDTEDVQIASFYDGEIRTVEPADLNWSGNDANA